MRLRRVIAACAIGALTMLPLAAGCVSQRLLLEVDDFRQNLIVQYEKQLMDNLIRAKKGLPFLQLDVYDVLVDELHISSLSGTIGETPSSERGVQLFDSAALSNTRIVEAPWEMTGGVERHGQMNLKLKPVTDKRYVYEAYIQYARDKDFLKGPCPRSEVVGEKLLWRADGKSIWHIPDSEANRTKLLALFLTTSVAPGAAVGRTVKITKVDNIHEFNEGRSIQATIELDTLVPNEVGHLQVNAGGRLGVLDVTPQEAQVDQAKRVTVQWTKSEFISEPSELEGRSALFLSPSVFRESSGLLPAIESLQNSLDRIRINQAPARSFD